MWGCACLLLALANGPPFTVAEEEATAHRLFFAHAGADRSCAQFAVFDEAAPRARHTTGQALGSGNIETDWLASRLAVTRAMTATFSIRGARVGWPGTAGPPYVHLAVFLQREGGWSAREIVLDRAPTTSGGIAVTEDDRALLVATQEREPACEPQRFFVGRYPLRDLPVGPDAAWPADGRFETDQPIGEILVDGPLAHLVSAPLWAYDPGLTQEVITIDTRTMTEIGRRVAIEPTWTKESSSCNHAAPHLRTALSNDGRHLFTNRTAPSLNVVDLVRRTARTTPIPVTAFAGSAGLAFDRSRPDRQLLAVHLLDRIGLFEWRPGDGLVQRDTVHVEPPERTASVLAPLAWTGRGDLVAAVAGRGDVDYLRWRVSRSGTLSRTTSEYDLCAVLPRRTSPSGYRVNAAIDVVGAGNVAPLHRPPGYASPTAPPTARPAASQTPTPKLDPTATPSREPTPTARSGQPGHRPDTRLWLPILNSFAPASSASSEGHEGLPGRWLLR